MKITIHDAIKLFKMEYKDVFQLRQKDIDDGRIVNHEVNKLIAAGKNKNEIDEKSIKKNIQDRYSTKVAGLMILLAIEQSFGPKCTCELMTRKDIDGLDGLDYAISNLTALVLSMPIKFLNEETKSINFLMDLGSSTGVMIRPQPLMVKDEPHDSTEPRPEPGNEGSVEPKSTKQVDMRYLSISNAIFDDICNKAKANYEQFESGHVSQQVTTTIGSLKQINVVPVVESEVVKTTPDSIGCRILPNESNFSLGVGNYNINVAAGTSGAPGVLPFEYPPKLTGPTLANYICNNSHNSHMLLFANKPKLFSCLIELFKDPVSALILMKSEKIMKFMNSYTSHDSTVGKAADKDQFHELFFQHIHGAAITPKEIEALRGRNKYIDQIIGSLKPVEEKVESKSGPS